MVKLRTLNITTILTTALMVAGSPLTAQETQAEETEFKPVCQGEFETPNGKVSVEDYSFWEGEWHVYETTSGRLMGFDEIKRDLAGCVLLQHWRQMNDRYSQPGAPYRFSGRSISGIRRDGKWHQLWVDNAGSHIDVTGGLNEAGQMVLETEWEKGKRQDGTEVTFKRIWTWAPKEDGTIHNWGILKVEGSEDRTTYDVTYRRNIPGGAASGLLPPVDSQPSGR